MSTAPDIDPQWIEPAARRAQERAREADAPFGITHPQWEDAADEYRAQFLNEATAHLEYAAPLIAKRAAADERERIATDLADKLRTGITFALGDGGCWHGPMWCLDCIAGTSAEVLRELLRTEAAIARRTENT